MGFFGKIFTWWDGATIGTLLYSARKGRKVGEDALGNRYFESKDGARRWVLYHGVNDASRVSPDWHGWLHHSYDGLPDDVLPPARDWQRASEGNLTGTSGAYAPSGALDRGGKRASASGDYQPWAPET
ncbi:MAG: NADH:ubiquinone oxidoreductase subunit NDUFA12 [Sphingopyxis sp.]